MSQTGSSESIKIVDDRAAGRLQAVEDGAVVGHIAYFVLAEDPHALVAVHTVVEPGNEGRGIAGSLVKAFYGIAADEGVPVVPLCPYAASWAAKHPEQAPEAPAGVVDAAKAQLASDSDLW
ncbi:GNAT family N-acetyltransferase [Streptomyces sp. NPDC002812]|uniref:GNAT family N-acetyltransferase n=1 Tax=unclassified Streptomyces TaxID=2593676 RepID=UPI00202FD881|nr:MULTISPECIES: GNAT family N-acetyltransferase [unclassified Streptomyces]MCM1968189.1 N-acetyltransferase [Streptomyces sp. G1]MCX5130192.1 N-acetyltransferase [Streptomyces sp. NBC_00347]MCX5301229.1 N-acetyltransferase [Streptomyces sp. NBC_00193]